MTQYDATWERLQKAWNALTAPGERVTRPSQRFQARLLASILLVLIALTLAARLVISALFMPNGLLVDGDIQLLFTGALILAYWLVRLGYYTPSVMFICLAYIPLVFAFAIPNRHANEPYALSVLSISVVLGYLFLSMRTATVLLAINLLAVAGFAVFIPGVTSFEPIIFAVFFILSSSLLVMLVIFQSRRLEASGRAQLEDYARQLRLLTDNMVDVIGYIDRSNVLRYMSPSAVALLERSPDELIDQDSEAAVRALLAAEDADKAIHLTALAHQDGQVSRVEYPYRTPSGRELWVETISKPFLDDNNMPSGMVFVSRDVTEHKRVEEALRQSELMYRRTLNAMREALHVVDPDLRITLVNTALRDWLQELGLETDLVGQNLLETVTFLSERVRGEYQRVFETGEPLTTTKTLVINGRERITQSRKIPIFDGDQVTRVMTIIDDITERERTQLALRESEERYRELFEFSPMAVCVIDENGRLAHVNRAGVRLLGAESAEELAAISPLELVVSGSRVDGETPDHGIEVGHADQPVEYTLRRLDGQLINVEARSTSIVYQGESAKMMIVQDITGRKQVERQRQELNIEKERVQMLQNLVGDISHDLRTPLTSMRLRYDLIKRTTDPQAQARNLEVLGQQLTHLEEQIENLLTLSRLDRGHTEALNFELAELADIVKPVIDELLPLAASQNQTLEFCYDDQLPPILIDRGELQRMARHLIVNALSYTKAGGDICVEIRQADGRIEIKVSDNGIGISAEDLSAIFEPFYRADPARNIDQGGMGLGLAIVRKIVEAHGGSVHVESTYEHGSTFRVYLPIKPAPEPGR